MNGVLFRPLPSDRASRTGLALLVVGLVAGTACYTRGITDESALSMHGDAPRHMMNGVFLWDFIRSGAVFRLDEAVSYAREYFARYPALSLGHHPPLFPVLLVPFYAVFGVSAFSARLAVVLCMVVAILALYSLTRRLYGHLVAGWASLLFAVQPFMVPYGQQVMSEAPMLALVLLTVDALLRFRVSDRTTHYGLFVVLAASTLYARQVAIFMFPTFALTLLVGAPWLRLFRRGVVLWTAIGLLLSLPIVAITLSLSPVNVALVVQTSTSDTTPVTAAWAVLPSILATQLSLPLQMAMIAGVIVSLLKCDRRILFVLFWITMVISCVVLLIGPYEAGRYAILAVPAYCVCAATAVGAVGTPWRQLATTLLALATITNAWSTIGIRPVGAGGYESAARYVTERGDSPTVLYSGPIDTGYFVFFVRKHDAAGRQVVLRSDKLLTTSLLGNVSVEEHIDRPEDIYPLLNMYGTRLIVIEDKETGSAALDWLRQEVQGDRFVERLRFPVATRDRRLAGVDLIVYEYLDAGPPDPGAWLNLDLPIIGRGIRLKLSDLLDEDD